MSNSLDPDQARHFVGPDLGQYCSQRLSADGTSRQRAKASSLGGRRGANFLVLAIKVPYNRWWPLKMSPWKLYMKQNLNLNFSTF